MLHNILVFLQNNASCILFMLYFLFWVSMVYDYFGYIKFDDAPFAFLMLINTLTACIPAIILGIQANIPNIGSDVDSIPKLYFIAFTLVINLFTAIFLARKDIVRLPLIQWFIK